MKIKCTYGLKNVLQFQSALKFVLQYTYIYTLCTHGNSMQVICTAVVASLACLCLFVSVTSRCSIIMAKHWITQTTSYDDSPAKRRVTNRQILINITVCEKIYKFSNSRPTTIWSGAFTKSIIFLIQSAALTSTTSLTLATGADRMFGWRSRYSCRRFSMGMELDSVKRETGISK